MHPPIRPASQPDYEHIAEPEGSTVDKLRWVHMAEQRGSEEDWHTETKQVYDSEAWAVKGEFLIHVNVALKKGGLGNVPGSIYTDYDFLCSQQGKMCFYYFTLILTNYKK